MFVGAPHLLRLAFRLAFLLVRVIVAFLFSCLFCLSFQLVAFCLFRQIAARFFALSVALLRVLPPPTTSMPRRLTLCLDFFFLFDVESTTQPRVQKKKPITNRTKKIEKITQVKKRKRGSFGKFSAKKKNKKAKSAMIQSFCLFVYFLSMIV